MQDVKAGFISGRSTLQRFNPHLTTARARPKESSDMNGTFFDVEMEAHSSTRCDYTPVYLNSRLSKQELCRGPCMVLEAERNSRVSNRATRRFGCTAEVTRFTLLEPCLAPRVLPTMEALLPSHFKNVDGKSHLTEKGSLTPARDCTVFSSEEEQSFQSFGKHRLKVSCSSEGLGTTTTSGCKSLITGRNSYKSAEHMLELLPQGSERYTMSRRAPANNGRDNFVGKCSFSVDNDWCRRWTVTHKRHIFQLEDTLSETSANEMPTFEMESRFQASSLVGVASVGRSASSKHVAAQIDEDLLSKSLVTKNCGPGMEYPTFKPAYPKSDHRGCGSSLHNARENVMCSVIGEAAGDNAVHGVYERELNRLWKGLHCFREGESDHWMDFTKARNLCGLKIACTDQELYSTRCNDWFDEGCDSSSESHEEIEDYALPGWNERDRFPSRHSLRMACRKRPRDDDGPSTSLLHSGHPHTTPDMWMKRLSARASFQFHPNSSRKIKTSHPCCDSHTHWPLKCARHDCCHDTSKRDQRGFSFARQHPSGCQASSQFLTRSLVPSAAAMGIVGATARQVHSALPG